MNDDLKDIFDCLDASPEVMYSSYFKKDIKQIIDIDFKSVKIVSDKNHNAGHNMKFKGYAVLVKTDEDNYRDANMELIFPKISFLKMLKRKIDSPLEIKKMFEYDGYIRIELIRESIRLYILESYESLWKAEDR